ncbi:MAG: hypothetical protein DME15_07845 [Candidatus Rokuibacteriota bacterium]|nr:MAG: hypothetical protein DME15_07845 [Candidatus Rokubacteria bacterium]
MQRRVVLTGRGVVSPLGVGIAQHWDAVRAGRLAVGRVERLAALGLPASTGAAVSAELLQPHLGRLPRKRQKLYNRATLLGMLGASLAMEDAGLGWDLAAMTDYLVASESKPAPGTLDMALANRFCMHNINPLDFSMKTLPNLAAGHVAIAHDAQGFCRVLTEGNVGGARAVGDAYRLVAEGDLDVALCGGADAQLEELLFAHYWGTGVIASDDGSHPGYVPGEGSGLLVLEDAEHARARGVRLHGEIVGFASSAGGGQWVTYDDAERQAERLVRALAAAVEEAEATPDVVSLHADGIPVHDRAEEIALARVFGGRADAMTRLRPKRLHADLGAAASPVELLACSAALAHATLPAVVAAGPPERPAALREALVISLGLFGECVALILRGLGGDGAH